MTQQELFYRAAAALGIGMLVGMERERTSAGSKRRSFAGMRTFALFGLLGFLSAMLADQMESTWIMVAIIVVLGALITTAYSLSAKRGSVGVTTESSALITTINGALCYLGHLPLAAATTVVVLGLLSLKPEMHRFARSITREDIYATLKFAVISAIVLPILPREPLGPPPFDVLNPYKVWLMVVFISAISFAGYVLAKAVGPRLGIWLTGLAGGLVSSTAVTLSMAERSRQKAELGRPLALAIMLAWTVMFARLVIVVGVVNARLARSLLGPMAAAALAGMVYCAYLYRVQRFSPEREDISFANPFELEPALKFGLLYAAVLLAARVAQMYLGDAGIYLSSVAAGLVDTNAIALSMAELNRLGADPSLAVATQAVVLAAMANTASKGAIVLASGSSALRKALWPGFLFVLGTGIAVAFVLI